jgi:Ribbon-helix-helix protein, copG family
LIEVLVVLTPPRDLFVFHVMLLRQLTAERAEFDPEEE